MKSMLAYLLTDPAGHSSHWIEVGAPLFSISLYPDLHLQERPTEVNCDHILKNDRLQ